MRGSYEPLNKYGKQHDPCYPSNFLFIYLFTYLFIHSFIYLFIHLFVFFIYLFKKIKQTSPGKAPVVNFMNDVGPLQPDIFSVTLVQLSIISPAFTLNEI